MPNKSLSLIKPASKFTGKEFLDLLSLKKWKWDHRATITRIRPDLNMISKESLQSASSVPPLSEVQKAFDTSSSNNDKHFCVCFTGFGAVPASLLSSLKDICEMMEFAESLKELDEWLAHNCSGEFQPFLAWFRTILQYQCGISGYIFRPNGSQYQIHIRDIFCLKNEDHLHDNVIKTIFRVFGRHYGPQYLYISPGAIQDWKDNNGSGKSPWFADDFGRDFISMKSVLKVFSLVHITRSHWGVLVVDLKMKAVSFGDSLDSGKMRIPGKVKKAIWRWLERIGEDINSWNNDVQRLPVPQQRHKNGSCGIIALNTIESIIDPSAEKWRSDRSAFHRIRYLKALIKEGQIIPRPIINTEMSDDVNDILADEARNDGVDMYSQVPPSESEGQVDFGEESRDGQTDIDDRRVDLSNNLSNGSGELLISGDDCRNYRNDGETDEGSSNIGSKAKSTSSAITLQIDEVVADWAPIDKEDVAATREDAETIIRDWATKQKFTLVCAGSKSITEKMARLRCGYNYKNKTEKCPFLINIRSDKDGIKPWYISKFINEHNHNLDELIDGSENGDPEGKRKKRRRLLCAECRKVVRRNASDESEMIS